MNRKCLKCHTWNESNDYCVNCGNVISPELIRIIEKEKRDLKIQNLPKSSLDLWVDRLKMSKNPLAIVLYLNPF